MTVEMYLVIILLLWASCMYMSYKYFYELVESKIKYVTKIVLDFNDSYINRLDKLDQKIKGFSIANANCCKAGIEKSNIEAFKLDRRIRKLEESATSVSVPELEFEK